MDFGVLDEVEVEETDVRFVQVDAEVLGVSNRDIFDPFLDVGGEHERRRITQQFQGELDVVGREWLTVRPLDAWPQRDVDALRVRGNRIALGQPRDLFARVVVVQIQEFVNRFVQDPAHAPGSAEGIWVHILRILNLGQAWPEVRDDQRILALDLSRCAGREHGWAEQ